MNLARPPKLVLLGFLSHFPVAGVGWQTLHYLVGFQRLGFDVYYVEAHGCTPSKLMRTAADDGAARAAEYISRFMGRFGLGDRWAYHALYESRYFGLSETQLRELYQSADLIINLHGGHLPTPELAATGRLVYLETDPVDVEIDLFHRKQETIDYLSPHCAFFTYGENLGRPDCLVPRPEPFVFHPTRQPVVMEFWEQCGNGLAEAFTTIGNWRQPWREVTFCGEVYHWSKHFEFHRFIDLPAKVTQPFELALSSFNEEDLRLLEGKGWRVRDALALSSELDPYREYIGQSRGEFTVAKDQNVRLRSGWFSDRAATYLAAGRPVITQETGFSNLLPTGEGLFAFSTMEEIVGAVEAINSDYERHRRAAWAVAREHFSHEVVLGRLLKDVGWSRLTAKPLSAPPAQVALPADLVVTPTSRWPTRLPAETLETALGLPQPPVVCSQPTPIAARASLVLVTHNGLAYTKMCLATLLAQAWDPRDEIILVDNASTDGTAEYLRKLARTHSCCTIILNDRNRGFAAANNQGLACAKGEIFVLLNNDTLVPEGWLERLLAWVRKPENGLVGPVTNRTCNEAQIDAPYRTWGELQQFARDYTAAHRGQGGEIPMLALFCTAFRRTVYEQVGPLDERFEVGMFEDDDYARRVRARGLTILCAEDVFVHHFGQASLGELCANGEYDRILLANRQRFEEKWGVTWKPHGRRITPEYQLLRQRVRDIGNRLPPAAEVVVISKGDEELVRFEGRQGRHFPQNADGAYANLYPADSAEAIAQLECLRSRGARYLLIPKPAWWWLEHYSDFGRHLETRYTLKLREEATCLLFDLGGAHG